MIERIKNIINPEEKPIDEMSSNEMIELLIKLNKCLRCLDSDEVRSDGMIAGDIVKRINKIEQQLNNKKINIEEFKEKITNLTEHNMYVVRNNLSNILLNCIPDTVDIYISIWIDLIMNDTNSANEDLCEILSDLNKNDLLLLEMIKTFMKYGEKDTTYLVR